MIKIIKITFLGNALKEELKKYEDKEKSATSETADKPVQSPTDETKPPVVEQVEEIKETNSDANTNPPNEQTQQLEATPVEPVQTSQIESQPEEKPDTQAQPSEAN